MNDIRAWLNGQREFKAGCALYEKYGSDAALINRLQQGETPTLKKALFYALKELLQPATKEILKRVQDDGSGSGAATPPAPVENPASLEAKKEADLLYIEMQNTRAQLLGICTVEESPADRDPEIKKARGRLARQIMDLQRRVDYAYDDYRYALANGQRRDKSPIVADEIDPLMLNHVITNLRKYLSKLRKKEQTVQVTETIAAKEALLKQYLEQYEQAKTGGSGIAG